MKRKINQSKILFALSIVLIAIQYVVSLGRFAYFDASIPVFVDIRGNTLLAIPKTLLAVLRLPTMGAIIFAISMIMSHLPYGELEAQNSNRLLWGGIALISSIKMSGSVMEMAFSKYQVVFRVITMSMAVTGAVILLLYILSVLRKKTDTMKETLDAFQTVKKMPVVMLLIAYVIVAVAPVIYYW